MVLLALFVAGVLIVFAILIALLWSRVSTQGRIIASLQRTVAGLAALASRPASPPEHPVAAPPVVIPAAPAPLPTPPSVPSAASLPVAEAPRRERRSRAEWEALIGGRLLNRIGALALVIGVGFFLNYAFDRNWIPEAMRVGIGAVTGLLLLAAARQAYRREFSVFAQGLLGAGIAVLYLSVYASFNFYRLVPGVVALLLMTAVTAAAFQQALRYGSLATAVLGWAGGFLTPVMLAGGAFSQLGHFSYLALLTAGILAVAAAKERWSVLHPLTFFGAYLSYFFWFSTSYTGLTPVMTGFFLGVFWGLFLAIDVVFLQKNADPLRSFSALFGILNAALVFSGLFRLLNTDYHEWLGPLVVVTGAAYCVVAVWQGREGPAARGWSRFIVTAVVFLVLGTEIQFEDFPVVMAWALEGGVLVWLGARTAARPLLWSGAVLLLLDVLRLLPVTGALAAGVEGFTPVLNERAATFAVVAAGCGSGAILLARQENGGLRRSGAVLHAAWCIVVFLLVTVEVNDVFRRELAAAGDGGSDFLSFLRPMALALAWVLTGLLLRLPVWGSPAPPVAHIAVLMLAAGLLVGMMRGLAYDPPEQFHLLLNLRVLMVALLMTAATAYRFLVVDPPGSSAAWIHSVLGPAIVLLVLVAVTGETRDIFRREIVLAEARTIGTGGVELLRRLEDEKQLSLSAVWLVSSILLMVGGLWKRKRGLRIMSMALSGCTILKIFIYDLSFLDTLYRIFSFAGLGVILLSVSWLYQKYKRFILE